MPKKKRHKSKNRKLPATHDRPAPGAVTHERYRGREILRDVLKGVLFIAIVLSVKLLVERTNFGKQLELMSYNFLQTQLSTQPPPITVVDISDLVVKDFIVAGQTVTATPRDALKEMIQAIAAQQPKAIGIDIDFSPDENGYILPSDPEFFQFCLDLEKQTSVPIFLGVKRTIAQPSARWLGEERYTKLAANILVPRNNRRMLNLLELEDAGLSSSAEKRQTSRSMSALLAEAFGKEAGSSSIRQYVHNWLAHSGLAERLSEKQIGAV